jgi:hypothetical protein
MTKNKANKLIQDFNGYNKTDGDFINMIHTLYNEGLSLLDGKVEYSNDMSNKHYFYKVVEDKYDEKDDWLEGKTIGYLSAYKCFVRGIDNNYEILAYIS